MEHVFLIPRNKVRTYPLNADTERMLLSPDWIRIPAHLMHQPSKCAMVKRRYRARKRAQKREEG